MRKVLKPIAVIASLAMFVIMIGGSLVTQTGSNLGCGRSWPFCKGQVIPDHIDLATIIEMAHRLSTGGGSFFVILLAIGAWFVVGHKKETKFLSIISVVFLVFQALLGAAAVIWPTSSAVLATHFGVSLISFASVLILTLLVFEFENKFEASHMQVSKKMKWHTYGLTIYSLVVVYTGAFVSHTKAALICNDFPLCMDPSANNVFKETVQLVHRGAAAIIFIWIIYLMIYAFQYYKHIKVLTVSWTIAFILVCLQILAGILMIYTHVFLAFSLLHSLFISVLFAVLCYLVLLMRRAQTK